MQSNNLHNYEHVVNSFTPRGVHARNVVYRRRPTELPVVLRFILEALKTHARRGLGLWCIEEMYTYMQKRRRIVKHFIRLVFYAK